MALYESFDLEAEDAADGSQERSSSSRLAALLQIVLVACLMTCSVAGAYAGIVYWAFEGSLLGVVVSALIAGVGVSFIWTVLTGPESP
jgi:hypothetical protein